MTTMSDDERPQSTGDEEDPPLGLRFPQAPRAPDLPEPPKLDVTLPPHPQTRKAQQQEAGGGYNKAAIATTAASAFITPILVLSVGGWLLDNHLHHQTAWLAFVGVLVGLVVGTSSLLRIIKRLED